MTYWKKLLSELPQTLMAIVVLSGIGLGIAHPELYHGHKFQHLVNEVAQLVTETGWS